MTKRIDNIPQNEYRIDKCCANTSEKDVCMIRNWPIKLKLAPTAAPFFHGCSLLIAADCTAFSYSAFNELSENRTLLICCNKFDGIDYSDKLSKILSRGNILSILVVRMEAPCCGSLAIMVRKAVELSGKDIPVEVAVISEDGKLNR